MTWERIPPGARVRITERWPMHAGEVGTVVHDDGGDKSVYIRLDADATGRLSAWKNGDGVEVFYSVAATRESVETLHL